jgi:hypothetical protein
MCAFSHKGFTLNKGKNSVRKYSSLKCKRVSIVYNVSKSCEKSSLKHPENKRLIVLNERSITVNEGSFALKG